jgi:hypothetical protein
MNEQKSEIPGQLRRIEGKIDKIIFAIIFAAVFYVADGVLTALKANQVNYWIGEAAFLGVALVAYFFLADFFGLKKSN